MSSGHQNGNFSSTCIWCICAWPLLFCWGSSYQHWCWGAPSRLRNANDAGGLATKPMRTVSWVWWDFRRPAIIPYIFLYVPMNCGFKLIKHVIISVIFIVFPSSWDPQRLSQWNHQGRPRCFPCWWPWVAAGALKGWRWASGKHPEVQLTWLMTPEKLRVWATAKIEVNGE